MGVQLQHVGWGLALWQVVVNHQRRCLELCQQLRVPRPQVGEEHQRGRLAVELLNDCRRQRDDAGEVESLAAALERPRQDGG